MIDSSPKDLESVLKSDYSVKIGDYIGQGWSIFTKNALLYIGFIILLGVYGIALSRIDPRIASPLNLLISPLLVAGFSIVALETIKGTSRSFGDLFKGFQYSINLVLANILVSIFIMIGFILLIIPGIYLSVAYGFVNLLILDRGLDFWQAMETSRKIISKQWFSFFGLGLLVGLINLGGALLVGLGLLVTIPMTFAIFAVAYSDIVGIKKSSY